MNESKLVKIYHKQGCPYCSKALSLLRGKPRIRMQEIDITDNNELREQMIKESSRTTVPQIFIGNKHIGGCDDLIALGDSELDKLLYE